MIMEHFYAELMWLDCRSWMLQLFPAGGAALLEDPGKDICGHTKKPIIV